MATYGIAGAPAFVEDGPDAPLPGHYEAEFSTDDGRTLRRFLTDRGRAELLRTLDEGDGALTQEEFDDLTVEPSLDALARRTEMEGGVGA